MHSLSTIEINPPAQALGTIILLHGLGADGNDFVPVAAEMNALTHLPLRFVFPNAPKRAITINNGYVMPAWYDISSLEIQQRADRGGIAESVKQLEHLIEHEKSLGIPEQNIILAGFSQGAVIALTTGIHYPKKLGGILALSGYLPFSEAELMQNSQLNHHTPIFLAHGTQDGMLPFALGQSAYQVLQKLGFNVAWHPYPMAHSVCEAEIADIARWLIKIFGQQGQQL
ncbi:MAG: alpha/beta hydrolase [Pseudomonadota bacterium]